MRRRFGEEAVDYLADPLLAGIHAGDADRLSMRALFPRLVEAERQSGSVIRAFRALRVTPVAARARSCRCRAASASSSMRWSAALGSRERWCVRRASPNFTARVDTSR